MTLPPELRNNIYELAFSSDHYIEAILLEDEPPSKSLLLTCREIYNEARIMHRKAYRDFWTASEFIIDDFYAVPLEAAKVMAMIKPQDLTHMTDLTIYDGEDGKIVYVNGLWEEFDADGASIELLLETRHRLGMVSTEWREDLPATVGYELEQVMPPGQTSQGVCTWFVHLLDSLSEADEMQLRGCALKKKLSVLELLGAVQYCKSR